MYQAALNDGGIDVRDIKQYFCEETGVFLFKGVVIFWFSQIALPTAAPISWKGFFEPDGTHFWMWGLLDSANNIAHQQYP